VKVKIKLHGLGFLRDKQTEKSEDRGLPYKRPEFESEPEFSEEEHTKLLGNIIKSVREIREYIRENGKITLGEAEKIANKYDVPLHLPLAELASRCTVDYDEGVILCHD